MIAWWDLSLYCWVSVILPSRPLEIVVFGYSKSQEAENALRRQMDELIQL
jgi:hypothetical protein